MQTETENVAGTKFKRESLNLIGQQKTLIKK
jgi:hypothetical protein